MRVTLCGYAYITGHLFVCVCVWGGGGGGGGHGPRFIPFMEVQQYCIRKPGIVQPSC